ncbi:hypothetical protein AHAS_Ahas16G0095500 [Arachis hypogaea]
MSLYIGDLDPEVDKILYDLFDQVGQVVSVCFAPTLFSKIIFVLFRLFEFIFSFSMIVCMNKWSVI